MQDNSYAAHILLQDNILTNKKNLKEVLRKGNYNKS